MKKILLILLLFISTAVNAQWFESYVYEEKFDTIFITNHETNTFYFKTYDGSNATVYGSREGTVTIYPNQINYVGEYGFYNNIYIVFKHNQCYDFRIGGYPAEFNALTNTLNTDQIRTLRYLEMDDGIYNNTVRIAFDLSKNKIIDTLIAVNSIVTTNLNLSNLDLRYVEILDKGLKYLNLSNTKNLTHFKQTATTFDYDSIRLGVPNYNLDYFYLSGGNTNNSTLTSDDIDDILKWFIDGGRNPNELGITTSTIYLCGGTAIPAPTSIGKGYADYLSSIGWNVCINESVNITTPYVVTNSTTDITKTTATGNGQVVSTGNATVTDRGICWSTSANPTTSGSHTSVGGGTIGMFSASITGLSQNTTYYVRAYATNSAGTEYGSNRTFTTLADTLKPEVWGKPIINISSTTATSGGNVSWDGGAPVTARGICWNTTGVLDELGANYTTDGTGIGQFTSNMTGLTANTTYYVQAYATNVKGTSFSSQGTFTTTSAGTLPTVLTRPITSVDYSVAYGGGEVTSEGSAPVTQRGSVWGTSPNPTLSNSVSYNGSGLGSFNSDLFGLTNNQVQYYTRAYATNSVGTSYGENVGFVSRSAPVAPTVTTYVAHTVTTSGAISGGFIQSEGSEPVTARGVVAWTSPNPSVTNYTVKTSDGSGGGSFNSTISGLANGTTYYYRAYATNYVATVYGTEYSFTTGTPSQAPVLTTTDATSITSTSASSGGNITSQGSSAVTARGVMYSEFADFSSYSTTSDGTGTGTFTSSLTGLTSGKTYYYKAYATNSQTTGYGTTKTFIAANTQTNPYYVTSSNSGNVYSGSTLNVFYPTEKQAGDLFVIIVAARGNDITITTPSGFTASTENRVILTDGTVRIIGYLFYKELTGSETGTISITSSASTLMTSYNVLFRGANVSYFGDNHFLSAGISTSGTEVRLDGRPYNTAVECMVSYPSGNYVTMVETSDNNTDDWVVNNSYTTSYSGGWNYNIATLQQTNYSNADPLKIQFSQYQFYVYFRTRLIPK